MSKVAVSLRPDIICTQETSPEYLDTLLGTIADYNCVMPEDGVIRRLTHTLRDSSPYHSKNLRYRRGNTSPEEFEGWLDEGNIIWNKSKFSYVSHGAIDIGIEESESRKPKRRLFWVRLQPFGSSTTILVTTAHLTWEGGTGREQLVPFTNTRTMQATRALEQIALLRSGLDEPVFFCGDMNDSWHVPFLVKEKGELVSADFVLNLPTEITHPARPCFHEERIPSQTRDWIFASKNLTPILSRVCADMTLGTSIHPSDHYPVLALYIVPPYPVPILSSTSLPSPRLMPKKHRKRKLASFSTSEDDSVCYDSSSSGYSTPKKV